MHNCRVSAKGNSWFSYLNCTILMSNQSKWMTRSALPRNTKSPILVNEFLYALEALCSISFSLLGILYHFAGERGHNSACFRISSLFRPARKKIPLINNFHLPQLTACPRTYMWQAAGTYFRSYGVLHNSLFATLQIIPGILFPTVAPSIVTKTHRRSKLSLTPCTKLTKHNNPDQSIPSSSCLSKFELLKLGQALPSRQ